MEYLEGIRIAITDLFGLLIAHLIGDFILQSDEMAKNKSSDYVVLTNHVTIYMIPFIPILLYSLPLFASFLFLMINWSLHFVTDAISSRIAKRFWMHEQRHNFFVTIGVDQFVHMVTLVGTFVVLKIGMIG